MRKVLAPIQRVRFTQSTLCQASIREKKGPSLGKTNVKIPHQRSPHAMKFEDKSHEETERQQRCARSKAWNLARNIYKLKERDEAAFYFTAEEWVLLDASTKEPEEREFVVDSGASMHMVRKKDLNSAELETMRTSRNPTTVMTDNDEVQTRQDATVYADKTPTHKTHLCITGCSQARTAQLMRLAQELHCHLCAPEQVLSSGVTHVSSMVVLSRAFLHEHFFFFFTYLSYLPHNENTQYIPHISKLPQSTSCAIKNHSGVKICTVAETRAQQLPQVMSPKNLRPSREAKHVLEIHIDDLMHRKNLEKKITELLPSKKWKNLERLGRLACKRAGGKKVCGGFRSELVSKRHSYSAELETVRISKSPTTVVQEDSTRDDEEANSDFWTTTGEFIYRHHVVPRVKLYVPREETFPIPMKYTDVIRTTYTSLDVMLEQQIEDYWNVDGEKRCVRCIDKVHKIRSTTGKATGRIHIVRERDLQGNKKLLVLMMCGQICGKLCPMQQRRKQNKDGLSRNQSSTMPDN